jgi:hypothetical protein
VKRNILPSLGIERQVPCMTNNRMFPIRHQWNHRQLSVIRTGFQKWHAEAKESNTLKNEPITQYHETKFGTVFNFVKSELKLRRNSVGISGLNVGVKTSLNYLFTYNRIALYSYTDYILFYESLDIIYP